ncbi:Diphthamide biosynthesis protein 1 [Hanseniaspora valbyensis]
MSTENTVRRSRFAGIKTNSTANSDKKPIVTKGSLEGEEITTTSLVKQPRARVRRPAGHLLNQIPKEILENEELNEAIKLLPSNYNFEIHKTIYNLNKHKVKRAALQFPEGLLIYSLIISDILQQFVDYEGLETVVMGDVSYGACCIDDFTARSLDCDIIIHYAHSCLVPIDVTTIKVLYVFVTIQIDEVHLVKTLIKNFEKGVRLATVSTIQFNPALHSIKEKLLENDIHIITPQIKPLSKGEILGCTSKKLQPDLDPNDKVDYILYIGDGRFHLESMMIHNPDLVAYKYDPYNRQFTIEEYDQKQLVDIRTDAIEKAKSAKTFGLVLGALGRQGNVNTLENLEALIKSNGHKVYKIVLSEIFPLKLAEFEEIDCFVQVACPRLSIDWGYAFNKPLLTPYECNVLFGLEKSLTKNDSKETYPMDYYETDGYGRGKLPKHNKLHI